MVDPRPWRRSSPIAANTCLALPATPRRHNHTTDRPRPRATSRCPPCKRFTPKLAESYKKLVAGGAKLEVIFVSSDRDQAGFDAYFGEMPWLAVPFEAREAKAKLSSMFGVEGIPTLILLDPALKTVNADARNAVDAGRDFPWVRRNSVKVLRRRVGPPPLCLGCS